MPNKKTRKKVAMKKKSRPMPLATTEPRLHAKTNPSRKRLSVGQAGTHRSGDLSETPFAALSLWPTVLRQQASIATMLFSMMRAQQQLALLPWRLATATAETKR
jgi:hypothetical protein